MGEVGRGRGLSGKEELKHGQDGLIGGHKSLNRE